MEAQELRNLIAEWKETFGGGMAVFDARYAVARDRGATPAEAQRAGVHATLDALAEFAETGGIAIRTRP